MTCITWRADSATPDENGITITASLQISGERFAASIAIEMETTDGGVLGMDAEARRAWILDRVSEGIG
jgi:hypothetical protein